MSDDTKLQFGSSQDVSIFYDGTDLVIDPKPQELKPIADPYTEKDTFEVIGKRRFRRSY